MNKNRKALIGVAAIAGAVIVIVVATSVFIEAEQAEEITTQQAQSIVSQNPGEVFEVIREVMDECVSEALFFANFEDIGDPRAYHDAGEYQAGRGDDRQQGIPQGMFENHLEFRKSLGPCSTNVV